MKESYLGYFFIVMGIGVMAVLMLFQDVTTTNQQNYYLTKEITKAAMFDSIDLAYYQVTGGKIAIDKEKFTENFFRRYAESASIGKEYKIKIYDIVEYPPKVSLGVGTKSNTFTFTGEQFDIYTKIDAIYETNVENSY